jgi:hypothetical protein
VTTRQEQDQIAWEAIHASQPQPGPPIVEVAATRITPRWETLLASGADEELAWSEFLHEFLRHKSANFFTERSTEINPVERQASRSRHSQ